MAIAGEASVDPSCSEDIRRIVMEVVNGPTTSFRAPLESYDAAPYRVAEDSYCAADARCSSDADCTVAGDACYVRDDWRWSSSSACSPSSQFNQRCGCCVEGSALSALPAIRTLKVSCAAASVAGAEAYTLNVDALAVQIKASTERGASYGLATLSQLLRYDARLRARVLDVVPLAISDAPRFPWRGFMLDTSRHFIPVDRILTLLDGMYAAKLNTFHWHIVDSTSFAFESAAHPELAEEGSWSRSNATIYSRAAMDAVVRRGRERFVDVVLELDTPAHTLAIARSHPEMMAQCWEWMAKSQYKTDVDSDDCMALDPTNAAARAMVATLFAEAAEIVGPAARHLHVGGDEVKFPCWNADPAIAAHVAKKYGNTTDAAYEMLQAEWTANVSAAAVVNAGKIPVLWQPTAEGPGDAAWDDAMPPNAVYMIWLNAESAAAYANVGKDVVYTTPFYVAGMGSSGCVSRCARACALAPRMPRASLLWSCGTVQKLWRSAHCFPCISLVCFVPRTLTSRRSQSSLCYSLSLSLPGVRTRARCSWTNVYNAPIMPAGLDPAAQKHVLGAEVCMWGESMSTGNLAMRSFGIGAAAAENFWRTHDNAAGVGSAAGLGVGDRYNRMLCHLQRFGIDAPPIMPSYCAVVPGTAPAPGPAPPSRTQQ